MSQIVEATTPMGEKIIIELKTPRPKKTKFDVFRERATAVIGVITLLALTGMVLYTLSAS